MKRITIALLALMMSATLFGANSTLTPEQAKAIAKEAYLYGFPMVLNNKTMYHYAVDKSSLEYKEAFNSKSCMARLYTVRLCEPEKQILDGSWTFPAIVATK